MDWPTERIPHDFINFLKTCSDVIALTEKGEKTLFTSRPTGKPTYEGFEWWKEKFCGEINLKIRTNKQ